MHIFTIYTYQIDYLIMKFILSDNSSDESFIHDDSSSEDEKRWVKEVKKQYRLIKKNEKQAQENDQSIEGNNEHVEKNQPQLYEIKENVEFKDAKPITKRRNKCVYYYVYI